MPDRGLDALLASLFGLLIGSFLNVVIHRWPREMSVVRPRSLCPACSHPIAWYNNIPVLSFAVLRGRCRHCRAPISWRYPLVEALTGAAFFFFVWKASGLTPEAIKFCLFAAILIALIFTDLETRLLPLELTAGGLCAGLAIAFAVPVHDSTLALLTAHAIPNARFESFLEALFGAFVPAFAIWLVGWIFEKLRHKQGLGFGDVILIAAIGSFLGIGGALLAIALGSVAGSVIGPLWIKMRGEKAATYQLPFGSFLGVGALASAMFGERILAWYGKLLGV